MTRTSSDRARSARLDEPQSTPRIFRVPMALGAFTAIGLLSALFGDGVWDAVSWLSILAPIAAVACAWHVRE